MSKIELLVTEYMRLSREIAIAVLWRNKIKSALDRFLDKQKKNALAVGEHRILRYPIRTVEWNLEVLAGLLERAGCPEHIIDKVMPRTVNEEELTALVEGGHIGMQQVHEAGKVRTRWAITVKKAPSDVR